MRKRPPWTSALHANSAQTLNFMKGNVHGALLDNLDSANGVEELTPTVESLPKHYAVMCAFLVVCPKPKRPSTNSCFARAQFVSSLRTFKHQASRIAFPGQDTYFRVKASYKRLVSKLGTTRLPPKHTVVTWITFNPCASQGSKFRNAPHERFPHLCVRELNAWNSRSSSTRSRCRWRPKSWTWICRKSIEPGDTENLETASVRSTARQPFYKRTG